MNRVGRPRIDQLHAAVSDGAPGVSKLARFEDLLGSRMSKVLEAMDFVASLSSRERYPYTSAHVDAIERTLQDKVVEVVEAFRHSTGGKARWSVRDALKK